MVSGSWVVRDGREANGGRASGRSGRATAPIDARCAEARNGVFAGASGPHGVGSRLGRTAPPSPTRELVSPRPGEEESGGFRRDCVTNNRRNMRTVERALRRGIWGSARCSERTVPWLNRLLGRASSSQRRSRGTWETNEALRDREGTRLHMRAVQRAPCNARCDTESRDPCGVPNGRFLAFLLLRPNRN